jgi:hypothetical protein
MKRTPTSRIRRIQWNEHVLQDYCEGDGGKSSSSTHSW